ncbi:sulfotransferase [Pelagicoccus sp. SDUM812002]|uniref:sulfotransferase family protein n=1 Tax=Pelagicoccus sp. SDUM812002 TaxID=3041266 RepID=UPI00280F9771|nr:sulfotransferase [Pelagicoccus sp. SDUM812002]MDQ8188401.1 sulfotransferase [Pelagicoccus sp. SDUM812002]
MQPKIIGTGVGRTGTYSLKLALEQLGFGPCYHMEEVAKNMPTHLPLWQAALKGNLDWAALYEGYGSAVDWPTSGFYRELYDAYPDAKFVLTTRSPESWADSFGQTINALIAGKEKAPPAMWEWLEMAEAVIERTGFEIGCSTERLAEDFAKHNDAVIAAIPSSQLLVFEVAQGWDPLCYFLGVESPDTVFPRSNNREEFWELVKGATT